MLQEIPFTHLTQNNETLERKNNGFFEAQEFFFNDFYNIRNIIISFSNSDSHDIVFSILLSSDKKNWKNIYTKTLLTKNKLDFNLSINENNIKFIKIRLDRIGYLKIKTLSFFGEKSLYADSTAHFIIEKTAYSVLFNETYEYLEKYISNFLMFTDENCFLFVNLSKSLNIDIEKLIHSSRVMLFFGDIERDKSGNTLLLGHLECFRYASNYNVSFKYFCTLASNSLFIRNFSLSSVVNQLSQKHQMPVSVERNYVNDLDVCFGDIPDNSTWMWSHIANLDGLHDHLRNKMGLDKLSVTQIEGLFAEFSEWRLVEKYFHEIEEIGPFLKNALWTAFEECIPISIFKKHGKSEFTNICYMMWNGYRTASTSDVIKYSQFLPEHLFLLKWFERDNKNPATKMVTTKWGYYFLSLLNITNNLNSNEIFEIESNFKNIPEKYLSKKSIVSENIYFFIKDKFINRDNISINNNFSKHSLDIGFILLENENIIADILFHSVNNNIVVSSISNNEEKKDFLIGYIYLNSHSYCPTFQILLDKKFDLLIENIVTYDEYDFIKTSPFFYNNNESFEYRFSRLYRENSNNFYVGIPIFLNRSFSIQVNVLE
ncbi:hypothetical protein [Acetobacter sp. P1H12_c]|uniref:hypothetical protein n=1 Tax=Acetobacter sp. P1H12_c TaxID=2762621 RepID=UPI001C041863|nr:hypothetical protein [Acetobacter sp. P1H12_c]